MLFCCSRSDVINSSRIRVRISCISDCSTLKETTEWSEHDCNGLALLERRSSQYAPFKRLLDALLHSFLRVATPLDMLLQIRRRPIQRGHRLVSRLRAHSATTSQQQFTESKQQVPVTRNLLKTNLDVSLSDVICCTIGSRDWS